MSARGRGRGGGVWGGRGRGSRTISRPVTIDSPQVDSSGSETVLGIDNQEKYPGFKLYFTSEGESIF